MPQFARPSVDVTIDNWQTQAGGTTNLFQTIDESSADDADYVRSQLTPTTDVYVVKLSSVVDPLSSTGHILRYRYGKDASSGDQIDIVVQLRQGYTNEGSQGTLIASATHTNAAVFPTAGSITLSGAEADSITDYSNLYVRVTANKP